LSGALSAWTATSSGEPPGDLRHNARLAVDLNLADVGAPRRPTELLGG
jgi:hypothetical protein